MVNCELCSTKGGALKPTNNGKWVHVLCAMWIPEVYCVNSDIMEPFVLSSLDSKRFKLKCGLCNNRGACIQCSYRRCTASVHPICALDGKKGYQNRIIKDEESGNCLWEIYCSQHSNCVKEAVKPSKFKAIKSENDETDNNKKNVINKKDFKKQSQIKARNAPSISNNNDLIVDKSWEQLYAENELNNQNTNDETINKDLQVKTFIDWPGQEGGEEMELNHYWDVIASFYPEHASEEV